MNAPAWLVSVLLAAIISASVRADIASLEVFGPHSGSAFSNLGAIPKASGVPRMANAVVTIRLLPDKGDDLGAECTATFSMTAGPGDPQPILVAFPVTGQRGNAVAVDSFSVTVDGVQQSSLLRGPIRFPRVDGQAGSDEGPQPTFEELAHAPWKPVVFPFGDGSTYLSAYYWSQLFRANATTVVEVRYRLTLHPQDLRYEKRYSKGDSTDVVPFDLMQADSTDKKAYFFDYILRSGATWAGPIDHETVTLIADPATRIDLGDERIVIIGRNVALRDDTPDARAMASARIDPKGIQRREDRIIWEIDHEKPTEDILIQIPARLHHGDFNPVAREERELSSFFGFLVKNVSNQHDISGDLKGISKEGFHGFLAVRVKNGWDAALYEYNSGCRLVVRLPKEFFAPNINDLAYSFFCTFENDQLLSIKYSGISAGYGETNGYRSKGMGPDR